MFLLFPPLVLIPYHLSDVVYTDNDWKRNLREMLVFLRRYSRISSNPSSISGADVFGWGSTCGKGLYRKLGVQVIQ